MTNEERWVLLRFVDDAVVRPGLCDVDVTVTALAPPGDRSQIIYCGVVGWDVEPVTPQEYVAVKAYYPNVEFASDHGSYELPHLGLDEVAPLQALLGGDSAHRVDAGRDTALEGGWVASFHA